MISCKRWLGLVGLTFLVPLIMAEASHAGETWKQLNEKGFAALEKQDYQSATQNFKQALSLAEKGPQPSVERAYSLNNLGLVYIAQGKLKLADASLFGAWVALDKAHGAESEFAVTIAKNIAAVYFRQDRTEAAKRWLKQALDILEKMPNAPRDAISATTLDLARVYMASSQPDEAMRCLYRAKKSSTKAVTRTKVSMGFADVYMSQGRYQDGLTALKHANELANKYDLTNQASEIAKIEKELLAAQSRPNLVIIRPRAGEIYDDEPILVKVNVENFKLKPPDLHLGDTAPEHFGHIHYTLDDFPLVASVSTQHMFGKARGKSYLDRGLHTLRIELVNDVHRPLNPPVVRTVTFYTENPGSKPKSPE